MKLKVLTRDFSDRTPSKQFKIITVEAENREKIWEEIENSLINSNTQAWVMSEAEFEALKITLLQSSEHFKKYLADYINEELDRGNDITAETVDHAFEAYKSIFG